MKTEKNILIAFLLNFCFSIFELIGGVVTNSFAILSDSFHDLMDSISIGVSYILERISKKKPDNEYTYGYTRYSILGSLITTCILLVGSLLVFINAFKRIFNPITINYNGMIIFAIVGVIVNIFAYFYTKDGSSLNQKSVYLHMLEDVLNWVIVLTGAIVMKFTNFVILDSLLSIGVSIFIFINALNNLKKVVDLFLEKTPSEIKVEHIKEELLKVKGIEDIHHIHIWSLDGINNYATMHVITNKNSIEIKNQIRKKLKEDNINHVTIELEQSNETCREQTCKIKTKTKTSHHH